MRASGECEVSRTVLTSADARRGRTGPCGRIRHAAVGPERGPCRGGNGFFCHLIVLSLICLLKVLDLRIL